MNDNSAQFTFLDEDQFKKLVAVLISLVTVMATVIAFLQSDASQRDDHANRDTKRYATEVMGRTVSGDAQVNFAYNKAYQAWQELNMLADSALERGDEAAVNRYRKLRDQMTELSPLLAAPYFDPETGETDTAKYETDIYLVDLALLTQNFKAAGVVKDAWDAKANTYIVHLTLLAVALFLFGLATTISGPVTRWIFSGTGMAITLYAAVWAVQVWLQPVFDLREQGNAIEAYARGTGLAYRELYQEAIAEFDQAITDAPTFAAAYSARAEAHEKLGDLPAAAADYELARANGDSSANTAGELAYIYYLQGRFDEAIAMNRTALESAPGELWIRFDLAVSLLAAGQIEAAKAEYVAGMEDAARQVAEAEAAGEEPPSDLWWSLDASGAYDLDSLIDVMDGQGDTPPVDKIANPEAVRAAAEELVSQLKNTAVALEFTGQPSAGALAAQITPFEFAEPIYDDEGEVSDYAYDDTFEYGVQAVSVFFDYENMTDGQEVLFKVYIDDEEDPSWRVIAPWDLGASGSAEKSLSLDYSDNFVLPTGEYMVEMYVDSHLAQRDWFVVAE
ncbi:MAG TPA: tetratricopeptide repeat protein [Anaerolineae bacterium]|nr:tetratricopeptide repeat protein [Anaerolineae bacterium]HMR64867.1 tetratricopeptide repeat protein [Anaerolineae bacterium]